MDRKDRQIVRELQKNGRLTNLELAERVNLSPSPCLRRLRNLEESGVIEGYAALVNQRAYGVPLTVFVNIALDKHAKDTVDGFERKVCEIDSILDCFMTTGDSDYLLRVVVPDIAAYDQVYKQLIQQVPLSDVSSSFAMEELKYTTAVPLHYAAG